MNNGVKSDRIWSKAFCACPGHLHHATTGGLLGSLLTVSEGAMASERDDILSLLVQAKHEYEGLLRQNDELTTKCHDMEVHCERLREKNEGLHKGT